MNPYALIADRLWDGSAGDARAGMALVVQGARIEWVGPAESIPDGVERMVFPGATVLPGLMDAHVHYSSAMGPAFLAAGVTTVRDVGNDLEWILARRDRQAVDPSLGPAILCSGFLLDGPVPIWKQMGRGHADAEALRESVRHEIARGVDAIKLYAGLDLPMLEAGVQEARKHRKFVLAHLGKARAEDAARAGLQEIEHLSGCGPAWKASSPEEQDALVDVLLRHEVVLDPTLVVWDRLGRILDGPFHHDERRRWVHSCHRQIWDSYPSRFERPQARLKFQDAMGHLKRFLGRLHERGATLALGTDTPFPHLIPGFSVHDELAMYVDAGLSPVDALRSATSVNARVFGISDRAGRIAPGFQADLVVVSGNPLRRMEDIGHVLAAVRSGRLFRPPELLESLERMGDAPPDDAITRDLLDRMRRPSGNTS